MVKPSQDIQVEKFPGHVPSSRKYTTYSCWLWVTPELQGSREKILFSTEWKGLGPSAESLDVKRTEEWMLATKHIWKYRLLPQTLAYLKGTSWLTNATDGCTIIPNVLRQIDVASCESSMCSPSLCRSKCPRLAAALSRPSHGHRHTSQWIQQWLQNPWMSMDKPYQSM